MVCLDDIWRAAGYSKHLKPGTWCDLAVNSGMIIAIAEKKSGKKTDLTPADMKMAIRLRRGSDKGTYADIVIALAYAEYLNPKLAIEVREVFLRYQAADPTLADEVLQRSSPEANEWAARRALSRAVRNGYTNVLQAHGVAKPQEFAMCTNATYQGLFGQSAKQLKEEKGIVGNLRDGLDIRELAYVMASEALSSERIEDANCQGSQACRIATSKSARFIRDAIEGDRRDRQAAQGSLF